MSAGLTADLVSFRANEFSIDDAVGKQAGVTLPQDSWLQSSGTGTVPNLVISYLS